MRCRLILLWMLLGSLTPAMAQVSVSIGINLPVYPELVRVPGYPVYYAPRLQSNFFFYDGMYWVYQGDNWYASSWYNGPWGLVAPEFVPLFVLRIPVRYYRAAPAYFQRWRPDAAPRWGEHWGNEWEQHRSGWDRWDRRAAPAPAPLPVYQRRYSGNRYPQVEQQQSLRSQSYRYRPRDAMVRQHFQEQAVQTTPAPSQQRPRKAGEGDRRSAPAQGPAGQRDRASHDPRQQPQQGGSRHEQQTPRPHQENMRDGKGASKEPRRAQGRDKDTDKGEERGQERNK